MPFISQDRRKAMAKGKDPETVGDLCYLAYKDMMELWKAEPRWTTYHNILKHTPDMMEAMEEKYGHLEQFFQEDFDVAVWAAAQVLYDREVSWYEADRASENGDVTGDEF